MLLVFLDFSDYARKYILSIKDNHAGFLEITRARNHNSLVDLYLSKIISILLQEFLLLRQIFVRFFDQLLQFNGVTLALLLNWAFIDFSRDNLTILFLFLPSEQ